MDPSFKPKLSVIIPKSPQMPMPVPKSAHSTLLNCQLRTMDSCFVVMDQLIHEINLDLVLLTSPTSFITLNSIIE